MSALSDTGIGARAAAALQARREDALSIHFVPRSFYEELP